MPIPIYYITEDANHTESEEATSAKAMAEERSSIAQPFVTKSSSWFGGSKLTKAPQNTPNELILLAHTDSGNPPSKIGGKSPQELANDFNKIFTKQKDKEKITDIFLISCEAGMGAPSLAQKLAAAMVTIGFSNIKIHAVAHPDGKLIGGGVEVTTRTGTITGGTIGQVNGYFYGNQKSREYHQYLNISAKSSKSRTAEEKGLFNTLKSQYATFDRKQAIIVNLVTDLEEMRAPYNTFTANGPIAKISADMAITLSFLKQKKNTLIRLNRGETNVTQVIDGIITTLKENSTFTHVQIMMQLQSMINDNRSTFTSWVTDRTGINQVTTHLNGYTSELNQLLNDVNGTSHKALQKKMSDIKVTEESPLLGKPDQPKSIQTQLREYAAQRKEEWGFHWDFLYLKTLSFWVSDCISSIAKNMGLLEESTDYLNIKYRDTKVNAADKLAEMIDGNQAELTPTELRALREGRLGLIANAEGFLDKLLPNSISTDSGPTLGHRH